MSQNMIMINNRQVLYRMTLKRMMMTALMMLVAVSAMADEQKIWLHVSGNGTAYVSLNGKTLELDKENKATVTDAGGQKVAVTVKPETGYTVSSVTAQLTTDAGNATRGADDAGFLDVKKASDTEYTFEMPKDFNVRIYVTISKKESGSKNTPTGGTDYSGTYYIASNYILNKVYKYDPVTLTNNYYLCPTEGWAFYVSGGTVTGTDNGQPFLTTHKRASGDEAKYKWIVEKHPVEGVDYYTFKYSIDYVDGESTHHTRYMSYSSKISGAGVDRMRVHLEKTENPGDNEFFRIVVEGAYLVISPKNTDADDTNNTKYLTVNAGNKDSYKGESGKGNGPSGYTNTAGIIGTYWDITDINAPFYLEDVITRPAIAYNSSNKIEITDQTGSATAIYYTTDGSTPTTSSTQYDGAFAPTDITTIKAVAVVGNEVSNVATFNIDSHQYLIQSVECTDFYMIPGDVNSGNTTVNTSSLFRSTMAWTFTYAGYEGGIQYYYIKNGENYLFRTGADIFIKTNSDFEGAEDKTGYKFSIGQWYDKVSMSFLEGYHIIPKGATFNTCIFKDGYAAGPPIVLANGKNSVVKSGEKTPESYTRWNIIIAPEGVLPASLTYDSSNPTDANRPAFLSSSTATKYFKIENVGTAGRYICPPIGEAAVGTATIGDNELAWYVIEAGHDDWRKYYYIVHASTDKYLKFNQPISNPPSSMEGKNGVLSLLDYDISASDQYQFVFAKSTVEGAYYIVPKGLEDATYNNYYALYLDATSASTLEQPIKSTKNRQSDSYKWKFVAADLFCNNPVFEESEIEGVKKITISCNTNGAKIYYTENGTDPIASSTLYSNSITSPASDENMVIRAKAIVSDGTNTANSEIVTMLYNPDIVLEAGSYTYNGSAWEPGVTEVSVTKGENKITAPTSPATYEVASTDYTNNTNASTNESKAKVTVRDVEGDTWYIWHASKEFTIEKKEIGLTWAPLDTSEPPLTSFVYNGIAQTPTATATGLVGTDECTITVTVSANEGSSLTEDNAINVGSYTATASALSNANYKLPEEKTRAFTITRAPVTVTADDKTKGYGDDEPELTATVTGMVNNESAELLITFTLSRAEGDSYGDYTITPAGEAEQGNYNVTYVTGKLTIGAKAIGDGTTPAEGITIDITYDGTNYQVTVKQGDNLLEEGETKDYTWTGTGTDTYVVTVTGHNNYANSAQATYIKLTFYDTTPDDNTEAETAAVYYSATQDLQVGDDFEAYYITNLDNNVLTLTKVEAGEDKKNYIPQNLPVLLLNKPDQSPKGFTLKPYTGTDVVSIPTTGEGSNILKVVTDEGGKVVGLAEVYVFSKGEFVLTMAGTLSKGKFYLENPSYNTTAPSRGTLRATRGGTTGIISPEALNTNVQLTEVWYSLNGQKFNKKPTHKGLYILNGKKVVIK